jgi:N-acetylmuramic acid 6-phosphate etherase
MDTNFIPDDNLLSQLSKMTTERSLPSSSTLESVSIIDRCKRQNQLDSEIADSVGLEIEKIAEAVKIISHSMRSGGRLFYFGAGTSGRLGVLDASECPPTFGINPQQIQGVIAGGNRALTTAIEGAEDSFEGGKSDASASGINNNDVAVGITASGRTPYVLGALDYARNVGAKTIGVTNNHNSALSQYCIGPCIEAVVGPEIVAGSSRLKSGTAQKMVLNMLTTQTMIELGKTYKGHMVDLRATNSKLKARAVNMVCNLTSSTPEQAANILTIANGSVKLAILMIILNIDLDSAKARLESCGGYVYKALEG